MTVYDNGTPIATAPVSTGMPGHPTPMGVFSVIQKDRYHHSNIYSDAPMPYMQRITWSGVAMHEGVVPGHPASHGCIRLPHEFAQRLWGMTKMGVRVVVTPRNDVAPQSRSIIRAWSQWPPSLRLPTWRADARRRPARRRRPLCPAVYVACAAFGRSPGLC